MNLLTEVKIKTRILDKDTGQVIKERPWMTNLVLDAGLNALAKQSGGLGACAPMNCFTYCNIGSGTNPVKQSSGAITFTQSGTTLTASGGFFTSGMVGSIFKWGTGSGGNERYITAFTSSTQVTVDTSETVSTPDVGVVWNVQQTALQTQLYQSNTYQTNSGDCGTTAAANVITHQRTFVFSAQASPYTVNEIGYSPITGTLVAGRLVLPSSDSVSPTNIYVVVIALTVTYSPSAPTAVSNVGTNIDTAGNAMIEFIGNVGGTAPIGVVSSTGSSSSTASLDGTPERLRASTATYTQNASVSATDSLNWPSIITLTSSVQAWTKQSGVRGECRSSSAYSLTTSGQTIYGLGIATAGGKPIFDIKLTTPFVTPNGTFSGNITLRCVYNRTLVN